MKSQRSDPGLPASNLSGILFDYERSLARLGGDPALFREIAVLFLEDSPKLLEQARQAQRERDFESLARAAHSLKNLSADFDAAALTEAALSVEQQSHDCELDHASFEGMEHELARLQSALGRMAKTADKN